MLVYFAFVLGIGLVLRRYTKTSTDFFLAGRAIPAWVCGLAFLSANLGAQEVIGMGASGAKYGIATSHFYWIGAIPAMVFVGIFMMPFYYGSRARLRTFVARNGQREHEPPGRGVVRPDDGARLRALVRLLVHGFPRGAARHGRRLDERRAADTADCRVSEDAVSVCRDIARVDC